MERTVRWTKSPDSVSRPEVVGDHDIEFSFLWPPCVADADIIFLPWFLLSIFFLAYSEPSQIACLPYFNTYTWCGLSANLGCRSEMCCMRLAENTDYAPSHNFVGLYLRN